MSKVRNEDMQTVVNVAKMVRTTCAKYGRMEYHNGYVLVFNLTQISLLKDNEPVIVGPIGEFADLEVERAVV